ncbi:carbohydrate-binding domain-containing protein [Abiotrophia defectiva]|uniref:carbohydrate-binding domain-containing protein n=1 Tax=Abiotrophia defectiva TaxID=46125 RepID=UPI0022818D6A|nr:carbohydrate-binding domain-containing protein [Abiotrophia defectiva]MCY7224422.1 carbohydrate-binding domain-containing protein [Abiotrophia defectiva]
MRKSFTIATLISLTASMSLAYPALAQSGAQESQSVTSFQAQTSYDESQATQVTLADQTATVTGQGASFSAQTLTISQAGTYVLTGSGKNLKLVVEAADTDQVHLVFQNLTLEGEGTLLQINKAHEVVISLAEGSQNALTESQASDDEKVKGTIHSQVPLTLNGTGSLTLTALTKNALEVEDDLKVLGGTYTVKAANHGFKAEGALDIEAATLTIEAGKDGLHAEHDETTERANVTLNPTQLSIAATEDGVDAGNELTIKGGTITVSQSEEGLEARVIRQLGGDVTIKSSDDGVNASAGSSSKTTDTSATSKTTEASATSNSADTSPSASQATSNSADTSPSASQATSNSADTSSSASQATSDSATASAPDSQATADPAATSQPDQANKDKNQTPPAPPASQAPPQGGQGPGGMPPGGQEESDPSLQIILAGGTLTIDAEGDGIDSNGTVSISGGSLVVNGSVHDGNGPLDATGDITITGGTVWALGTSDMLQGFAQGSTQASITANIAGTAGQTLIILDANGKEVARQTVNKDFQAVIMSSVDLVDGQTYTIQVEGTTQTATAALVTPVTGGFHP